MKIKLLFPGLVLLVLGFTLGDPHPPGTVKIVDSFFADQTEITNIYWKEYLYWLKDKHGRDSEQYQNAKLDTTVWTSSYDSTGKAYLDPMAKQYHLHPAYDSYPVVGVSHQQAKDYCSWRTMVVKEMLEANYTPQQIIHFKNLQYRLPTVTEWELVVRLNRDRSLRPEWKEKHDGQRLFNLRIGPGGFSKTSKTNLPFNNSNSFILAPATSYLAGELDIYNLYGNVAEMVEEPNKAMGGGWIHTEREALSKPYFSYEQPSNWLGFRCVCSISPPKLSGF